MIAQGSVQSLLIFLLLWAIIMGIVIGWLRSWGAVILYSGITLLGVSFIGEISNFTVIILRLAFGICIIVAGYLCFREYKLARKQDKEEASTKETTSVILPTPKTSSRNEGVQPR